MTVLMIIVGIVIWVVCGVIAYGIVVADIHHIWSDFSEKYGDEEWLKQYPRARREAAFYAACGPLGLLTTWITRLNHHRAERAKGLRFHA